MPDMEANATDSVLDAALKLSPRDRAAIALGLLESLDEEEADATKEELDEIWAAEVERRLNELDSGESQEIEAFEAIAKLRAELRK